MKFTIPVKYVYFCRCGSFATHHTYRRDQQEAQCCRCYVNEGNTPFDGHPSCVAAWQDKQAREASLKP